MRMTPATSAIAAACSICATSVNESPAPRGTTQRRDLPMTGVFLGIDVGTSAVKALLADERQRVVAEATRELAISRPQPLWSEQNPEDWWSAVAHVVLSLRQAAPRSFAALRAVGLSGQMHGA